MARITIQRRNGTATRYFWSDAERGTDSKKTVYKRTDNGIKRMRGVHYNTVTKDIVKD